MTQSDDDEPRDGPAEEPAGLPKIYTPEEVAGHFGWSERRLRDKAREFGACRILGNRMVLTTEDVDRILEATRPAPIQATSAPQTSKGLCRKPVQRTCMSDYEELLARRKKQERAGKK